MPRRSLARKLAYFCWALLLVAGLSFNGAQAQALHSSCASTCESECGEGKCRRFMDAGCSCFWRCTNGSSGSAICVA